MTEKSRTTDDVNFPPMSLYEFVTEYEFDRYAEDKMYDSAEYHNWYRKYVIENHQFMTRVFILRDPDAIRYFEKIITSYKFFRHVIVFLDEHKQLREFIRKNFPDFLYKQTKTCEEIPEQLSQMFTRNIIIPENLKNFHLHDFHLNGFHSEAFKNSSIERFIKDNPIKINFRVGYSIARLDDHLVFKFY